MILLPANKPATKHGEDGFVLVSTIWIAGLLAVVATAFAITVRSHTLGGSNFYYNTKAEYVADGMARQVALTLAEPELAGISPPANGEAVQCNWSADVSVSVSVQDQGGLVDINTGSPDLFHSLFMALGANTGRATALISEMEDFRDPDSVSADGSAEPITFPSKSFGPKNAPFSIVEELDQVPGMDAALLQQVLPLVTVYGQQTGIDPSVAPPRLLALLAEKEAAQTSQVRFVSPTAGRTFRVDVIAELKNGARFHRAAMISLLRQPNRPFAILEWSRVGDAEGSPPLLRGGPTCFN